MAAAKNPAAPKQQSLGTRAGKLLNKLEKIDRQRTEAIEAAPRKAAEKYDEKRAKAIAEADADVIELLRLK
jgi:hypothetical protein